jgi:hypothetical protein
MSDFEKLLELQMKVSTSLQEQSNRDLELFKKLRRRKVGEQWMPQVEEEPAEAPTKAPTEFPSPKKPKEKPRSPIKPDTGVTPEPKG